MIKQYALALIVLLVPSCYRRTPYRLPQQGIPQRFMHTDNTHNDNNSAECIAYWWQQFNDETLNQLIRQALEQNYDLRIAQEKINEMCALYQLSTAQLAPQIDGIVEANRTRYSKAITQYASLPARQSFFEWGINTAWEIDIWGRLRHLRSAQLHTVEAQVELMHNVRIMLIAQVAQVYTILCSLSQQMALLTSRMLIEQRLVTLQQSLYQSGLDDAIAVTLQQQVVTVTQELIKQLYAEYAQAKNQLAFLLGISPQSLEHLTYAGAIPLVNHRITPGLPSDVLRRRPDIRQAEQLVMIAYENERAAVLDWFPRFNLLGTLASEASQSSQLFTGESLSWTVGPSITLPLLRFGRIQANVHAQQSRKKQALLTYSNTVIQALKEVEDMLVAYGSLLEQSDIVAQRLEYARKLELLQQSRFQSGIDNEINALNSSINLLNAQLDSLNTHQALSTSMINLYKALGGGW